MPSFGFSDCILDLSFERRPRNLRSEWPARKLFAEVAGSCGNLWVGAVGTWVVGFICCVLHYLIPAIYDYDFTASVKDSDHPIPNWVWLSAGILLFASHTLDGIDGKQARRTGTSSPLGKIISL